MHAAVEVVDQSAQVAGGVRALPDRHLQRVQRQIGAQIHGQVSHDDDAGVDLDDDRRAHSFVTRVHK